MASRLWQERLATALLWASGFLVIGLTGALFTALFVRALPILHRQPLPALLTGTAWQPSKGIFGFAPFLAGSLWVTLTAMALAVPLSLLTAIYLAEYARPQVRLTLKPLVDLMAGIPSVVYGVFGVLVIVPAVGKIATFVKTHLASVPLLSPSMPPTGYSVLAGGIVLALMVSPTIIAITDEVLRSVPMSLREATLALGATRWETVRFVVLRAARPGIVSAILLGFARAFGETMAVLMVVGNVPSIPKSLFDPAYPLPALIANNYGEMMSVPLYDAALMLAALLLFVTVLVVNLAAQLILRRLEGEWAK
jgi:phosphate transport system permease protein